MFEGFPTFEEILDEFIRVNKEITKDKLRQLYQDLKNSKEESTERYLNEMHGAN